MSSKEKINDSKLVVVDLLNYNTKIKFIYSLCYGVKKKNNVEFELEIKNKGVKSFQDFLFTSQIEKFEHKLAAHFYKISINWLDLKTFCSDWLVNHVRKIAENQE